MSNSHNLIKLTIILLSLVVFIYYSMSNQNQEVITEVQPEPVVTIKEIDQRQLQCLADNIYYEAGGEPTEGKAAVARVVLNRVNHGFAPTPCSVVYQAKTIKQINEETDEAFWVKVCQFSWVCEGKKNPNRNSTRYQNSLQVAKDVLIYDKYKDIIPKSVLFFHNTSYINHFPHEVVKRIGNHIFYKKKHGKQRKVANNVDKPGQTLVLDQEISGKTVDKSG